MARLKDRVAVAVSIAVGVVVCWAVYTFIYTVVRPFGLWEVPAVEVSVFILGGIVALLMRLSLERFWLEPRRKKA